MKSAIHLINLTTRMLNIAIKADEFQDLEKKLSRFDRLEDIPDFALEVSLRCTVLDMSFDAVRTIMYKSDESI